MGNNKANGSKSNNGKAAKLDINQLIITQAYQKTFSTGKRGFFGKGLDPATGKKYQITGAVEIGS